MMSREFGSCDSGYFHYQMQNAASDCLAGCDELTRLWGSFFKEFEDVAYAIASSEAGDSGPDFPILETMRKLESIRKAIRDIEWYLKPFDLIATKAVEQYIKEQAKKP